MLRNRSFGFTLIELLVVISIIGILVAISAAAFTTAQQKARNAKRQADITAVSKAFEQYYATNSSSYNANCNTMAATAIPGGMPSDPKTQVDYSCTSTTSSYCVCATLEPSGTTEGNSTATADATCSGLGTSGQYFCMRNQQ